MAVVDARRAAEGVTGHTSAHLTEIPDCTFHGLLSHFGEEGGRLAIEAALRLHVGGDVGDVDPDPEAATFGPGRDGVVEVAGAGRIDREGRLGGEVATPAGVALEAGDGAPCLLLVAIPERRTQAAVGDQRRDDVAGVVGTAEVDDRLAAT